MRVVSFVFMMLFMFAISAQIADSVSIKEIVVSADMPLNDKKILDFYRSTRFSSVDDILNRMNGVQMIKRGAFALEPQIGGFSSGQINVTIDGMKIFGACTDKMDPVSSYIEPVNLQNIQLHSGTRSIKNGVNLGGSLDFSLKELVFDDSLTFRTKVGFGFESNGLGRAIDFSTNSSKGKWAWGINSVYRKSENYQTATKEMVSFSQFEKINLHLVSKYDFGNSNYLKSDFLFDRAMDVGYPALPMDVSKAQAFLFGVEYTKSDYLKIKLYANDVIHVMDDSQRDSLFSVRNFLTGKIDTVMMHMDMPGRSSTVGAFVESVFEIRNSHRLELKVDNYLNRSIAEMTMYMRFMDQAPQPPMYMQTWPDMLRNVLGVYLSDDWKINRFLSLQLNGRLDYVTDYAMNNRLTEQFSILNYDLPLSFTNYTKGLNIQLNYRSKLALEASLNIGWADRAPTHTELFGYYLYNAYDGYDYLGNPDLQNEKSLFSELGLKYTSRKLKINLTQNLSKLDEYIYSMTVPVPVMNLYAKGIRQYHNYPQAFLYNSGFQLFWMPIPQVNLLTNTSYTYGQLIDGQPLPYISPLTNFISLRFQVKSWQLILENEYAFRQTRVNSHYGETFSPSYSVFNAKVNYDLLLGGAKLNISLGVSNILNEAYYTHMDWSHLLRPGRSVSLYLNLEI